MPSCLPISSPFMLSWRMIDQIQLRHSASTSGNSQPVSLYRNSPHKLNISHSLKDLPPKVIFNPLIFLCCCKCAQYLHNIYYWLCLESNNVLFLSSLHSCLVSFKLILILGIIHKGRWEVGAMRVTLTAEVTKC